MRFINALIRASWRRFYIQPTERRLERVGKSNKTEKWRDLKLIFKFWSLGEDYSIIRP
ncbi:hypothetical protein TDIS_0123 [Thermosulfurimonas dismutans]|uniref:Uncharacterized protein n=1 Tax=Thermosulfurimonas dismutans TaxID=999894 RepID=A0A179D678_9BACT|nr:hypothetical protein TDIS_0123 [Thermosulfurimonas dismutans]